MLSIGTLTSGHGFYYTDLAREQYYLEGGEPPGSWYGYAAEQLGFTGQVEKDVLQQVLQGFGPDGSGLVQNAGKESRQAGLDLTFSADKSVSVLWALGDEGTRKDLERAHSFAVDFALSYLEREAAWTRRGHGGEEFEKCRLLFARFVHSTSRAEDPNLHTHVLVPNVGLREDGRTAALWNKELYQHKMAAGAVYRASLAYELGPHGLGYELEADEKRGLFRIASVPKEVTEHFSKRRAQIELELQEHGYSKSAKAADRANLNTREVKGHASRAELFPRWEAEARSLGFCPASLAERAPAQAPPRQRDILPAAFKAAESLGDERAVFRPQDLVRATAHRALNGRTSPQRLLDATDTVLDHEDAPLVHEGKRHGLHTSRKQLTREGIVLTIAAQLDSGRGLAVSDEYRRDVKGRHQEAIGSAEREAAFDYLTCGNGSLKLLAGVAGTGKTSLLNAAREAWEKEGYKVLGMAVAGKAARELASGAGIKTETVRKRQLELDPTVGEQLTYHASQLFRAARWGTAKGYNESPMSRLKLDSKTVVVIDECSMLGLKDTQQILRLAQKSNAKVVMVGDERQLPAIESVSPFEALGKFIGRFELTDIKRQNKEWMQHAVRAFANGDTTTGLSLLKENGSLNLSKGGPNATKEQLVSDWLKADSPLSEKLILTATKDDARDLNARAQDARRDVGVLGKLITVTLGSGEAARRNDRVLFERNDRRLDVRNGELGTVIKIHKPVDLNFFNKGEVTIEMDHGKRVRVDLNRYKHTSLGYALTTHKAQGSTVDRAFAYTTPATAARDMQYVQISRAREEIQLYAPGHDLGEDLRQFNRSLQRRPEPPTLATHQAARIERELEEEKRKAHSRALGIRRSRKVGE